MSSLICLVLALIVLLLLKTRHWIVGRIRLSRLGASLPGPKGRAWPAIGDLLNVPHDSYEYVTFLQGLCERATAAGHTMFRLWAGPDLLVIPTDGPTVKAAFESNTELLKGNDYDYLRPWLGDGLLVSTDDKWRERRKLITPSFHFAVLESFVDIFNEEAQIMTELVASKAASQEPVDMVPFVKRCALDIICSTAMNAKVDAQQQPDSEYVRSIELLGVLFYQWQFRPFLKIKSIWKWLGYQKQYDGAVAVMHKFTRDVIQERIAAAEGVQSEKGPTSFLDTLVGLYKEGVFTLEDLREEVDTFMFEGHDTTSSGISWFLWAMATNPEHQEKVYQEIVDVLGTDPTRSISSSDIRQLKYLELCVKETMRIFPPVPFTQRKIRDELQLGNYTAPRGSIVVFAPIIIQRNPKNFPDPLVFNPERVGDGRHAYDYVPFNAGPRNCIGQRFALLEEKIVVATVLRRFKLTSTQGGMLDKRCGTEMILRPENGVVVTLTERC